MLSPVVLSFVCALSAQVAEDNAAQYRVGIVGSLNAEVIFGGSSGGGAGVNAFGAMDFDAKRWRVDVALASRFPLNDYIASYGSVTMGWPTTLMGVELEAGVGPALGIILTRVTDSAFPYMPFGLAGITGYGALGIPLMSWLLVVAEVRGDAFVPVPVPTVWLVGSAGGGIAVRF
jgi:hypothetical protein